MGRARVQRDAVVQQVRTLFALGTIDGMTDGRLLERFTTSTDESAEAAFSALVEVLNMFSRNARQKAKGSVKH